MQWKAGWFQGKMESAYLGWLRVDIRCSEMKRGMRILVVKSLEHILVNVRRS